MYFQVQKPWQCLRPKSNPETSPVFERISVPLNRFQDPDFLVDLSDFDRKALISPAVEPKLASSSAQRR